MRCSSSPPSRTRPFEPRSGDSLLASSPRGFASSSAARGPLTTSWRTRAMRDEPGLPEGSVTPPVRDANGEVATPADVEEGERLVLGDLINRVLDKGVVISGHVTISVADIDLVALDLRVLITSIQTAIERAGLAPSPLSANATDADLPVLPPDPGREP